MKKFTTLVAIDFSKSSYAVLAKALNFTQKMGGELHVVHIIENSFFSKKIDLDSIKDTTFKKLVKKFSTIKYENYHCISGKVKVQVANTARILNADVIIMGNSGETHFLSELLMGSHTKEIIKYAQTPVLVIKIDHEIEYQNILVLTDLSQESADAIKKIAKIFPNSNIKLVNLYYLPLDNRINIYGFGEKEIKEYLESVEKESEKNIDEFLKSLALSMQISITASAINSSLNPKQFKEEVAEINYDLLAIHATQNVSFFAFDILENSVVDVFVLK
ncbi:universal stress protein [Sulfurimonas sp.]|jgi:nucleotide-binding universal stress UspA family protein|uniref:universal stress protein n=1 Tax=Sulfurimonas sp. TaxID=2022749 RepID=UPI0025F9FF66|nr:universal stress protein [Sulfurimonas sp.]MCK9472805.1 universal stress protein [Sulfurimonas sp.]